MTKSEFEELQLEFNSSGMTLKSFLKKSGIAYSTYNYWNRKIKEETRTLPIAPIEIRPTNETQYSEPALTDVALPGVTLAFPNGVRAHFGRGSETVLMDVLTKSMTSHVLPQ